MMRRFAVRTGIIAVSTALAAGMVQPASGTDAAGPADEAHVAAIEAGIDNPGFEDVTADGAIAGWFPLTSPACGTTVEPTTEDAHSGERSAKLTDPTAGGIVCLQSSFVDVLGGQDVRASAWMRTLSGTTAWLTIRFHDDAGALVGTADTRPGTLTEWTEQVVTAKAPMGATRMRVMLYGGSTTAGVSLIDDVTLTGPRDDYDPTLSGAHELFVDDYRIATRSPDVERVVHPPRRSAPTLTADKPWEANNYVYSNTVLYNPDLRKFQAWYGTFSLVDFHNYGLYAESVDGVRWTKPELGLHEYQGSTANNIYSTDAPGTVLYDPADPDPDRRYKMLAFKPNPRGYHAYTSPDGIHWTPNAANPVIPNGDVQNLGYDPYEQRYYAITKQPMPPNQQGAENRVQFISFSDDFVTFTDPVVSLEADVRDKAQATANGASDMQVYSLPSFAYEGIFIGLPAMYEVTGTGVPGSGGDGTIEVQVAASRDLDSGWNRPSRDPLIPRTAAGDRDDGMVMASSQAIIDDSTVRVFYTGWDGTHGTFDRRTTTSIATWRRDGFVSMSNAGDRPGLLTTMPVTVDGSSLHVNVAPSARQGGVRAELLDENGAVIPGYSLADSVRVRKDTLDGVLAWSGKRDLSALQGQEVRIRFEITGADLYSFWLR